MVSSIAMGGVLADPERFQNKEDIKAKFEEHYNMVKRVVPEDRLLVLQLGEGWNRLCEFLDKPVPNEPYPRTNSTKELQDSVEKVYKQLKEVGLA